MRYCGEQGCRSLISSGRYCEGHKRRRKKKVVYSKNKSFYASDEWKYKRSEVYQREKGCCEECGKFVFGRRAHVHHIVPIKVNPSLRLDDDNLMLLCSKCHVIIENEMNEKKNKFEWKL